MFAKSYNPTLVQEFYSNLSPTIKILKARGYQQVLVREKMVKFLPDSINEFLEYPTEVKNGVFDKGFKYSEKVMKEIIGGKCSI